MQLEIHMHQRALVNTDADAAWALLAHIPDSISHFPTVRELVPEHDGYTWKLEKIGVAKLAIKLRYHCRYTSDRAARTVTWTGTEGMGNAVVDGRWQVHRRGEGSCELELDTRIRLDVPVPRLMKKMAQSVARDQQQKLSAQYLANLKRTLEGGDGRVNRFA